MAEAGGWRHDALHAVMVWTTRLGGALAPVLLLSVAARTPARLLEPGFLLMFGAYAAAAALRYARGLGYRLRALGFCSMCFVTGTAALFSLGVLPGPTLVCSFVVIAARLFLGTGAMLVALALSTGAVVAASLAQPPHPPGAEVLGA